MDKHNKIYTWQAPDRADFDTQLSSFMAVLLLNDSPISKQILLGVVKADDAALKFPGVGDASHLAKLIFTTMVHVQASLSNTASLDSIRAPTLHFVNELIAKCEFKVGNLLSVRARLESCFHGSLAAHIGKSRSDLHSVRYNAAAGLNSFFNKLDSRMTALEALLTRSEREPVSYKLVYLYDQLMEMPPAACQVTREFLAPLSDETKDKAAVAGIDFPHLVKELREKMSAAILNPQQRSRPAAAAATASLPEISVNSSAYGKGQSATCAFHGPMSANARSDCKHYADYLRDGNPAVGTRGAKEKIQAYKTSKFAKSYSIRVPPGVSVNSSGFVDASGPAEATLRFGVDTHTTSTVVQDASLLHNVKLYDVPQPIFNLDKKARSDISIVGRGDLKLVFTPHGSEPYEVTLTGALLARSDNPDALVLIKAKPLSGTKQIPIHLTIASPPRLVFRDDDGADVAAVKIYTQSGQFFISNLRVSVVKPAPGAVEQRHVVNASRASESTSLASVNESRVANPTVWHQRLGHIGPARVTQALKDQGIKPAPGEQLDTCGPCAYKASSTPILSSAESKKRKRNKSKAKHAKPTPPTTGTTVNDLDVGDVMDELPVAGNVKAKEILKHKGDQVSVQVDVRKPGHYNRAVPAILRGLN